MMWKANSFFLKSCCFFGVFSVMVDEKAKVLEGCKLNTDGSCAVLKTSVWLKECCACSGHNTVPSLRFNCYFLLFFGSVRVVVSLQCFPSPKIWLLFAQMLCCMSPAQLASRDPVSHQSACVPLVPQPPTITLQSPKDYIFDPREHIIIHCEAKGNPQPRWGQHSTLREWSKAQCYGFFMPNH